MLLYLVTLELTKTTHMYTESDLISFASYIMKSPSATGDVTDGQLENWKWENGLPLIDEGTELYEHPCLVNSDGKIYKGCIKKQYDASRLFAYDVQVNLEFTCTTLYNVAANMVELVDLN